jgi:hypothetical protein
MIEVQEMRESMIPTKLIGAIMSFFELQEKLGNEYWNREHFSASKYSRELKMLYMRPLFSDNCIEKYREDIYAFESFLKQNFHRKTIVSFYVPNPLLKSKTELDNSSQIEDSSSTSAQISDFVNH